MNIHVKKASLLGRPIVGLLVVGALLISDTGCGKKKAPTSPVAAEEPTNFEGSLDILNANSIMGWAWDKTKPEEPIQVDIFDGATHLGTVKADLLRDDLVAKGRAGNGRHGFSFPTPQRLVDGKPHEIHARVKGTEFELHGSPTTTKFERR